ncbi:hypothetical protein Hanom_Chr02g00129911 [Helianthus anomalus]
MKKLQQQRAITRANREMNAQTQEVNRPLWEDELDRQLADFHMLATTTADPNLNQIAEPQLLPLFLEQRMELEPNQENQFPIPAFDPNEIPIIIKQLRTFRP